MSCGPVGPFIPQGRSCRARAGTALRYRADRFDSGLDGVAGQLCSAACAGLVPDPLQVRSHRVDRKKQPLGSPSRHITTSGTSPSAKTPRPAAAAAGPPTRPPSAPPSPWLSKTPATCTSPKAAATTPPQPNPPPPRLRLGQKRTITEHAGALGSTPRLRAIPGSSPGRSASMCHSRGSG